MTFSGLNQWDEVVIKDDKDQRVWTYFGPCGCGVENCLKIIGGIGEDRHLPAKEVALHARRKNVVDPILYSSHKTGLSIDELRYRMRSYQLMARYMAQQIPVGDLYEKFYRAGGDVICALCRLEYTLHPEIKDMPTFHRLCNGEVVKT
jgi:hypothetical protein